MKAILVIDMPNDCSECPCFYDYLRCQAKAGVNVLADERPNNCPLKPMPQKKTTDSRKMATTEEVWYNGGFNTCIDEILGDTNNE